MITFNNSMFLTTVMRGDSIRCLDYNLHLFVRKNLFIAFISRIKVRNILLGHLEQLCAPK